jgi:hypothetical protein
MQQREMVVREQIALEQAKIENLKQDIQACTRKLTDALNKRYELLGIDESVYLSISSKLDTIVLKFKHFVSAGASEITDNLPAIDSLYNFIVRLKETTRFHHLNATAEKMRVIEDLYTKISDSVNEFNKQISVAQSSGDLNSPNMEPTQTFQSGNSTQSGDQVNIWVVSSNNNGNESLFRIAGYPQVYGDPYQWRKIYLANKDLIDKNYEKFHKYQKTEVYVNPQDILFPGQTLKIPR